MAKKFLGDMHVFVRNSLRKIDKEDKEEFKREIIKENFFRLSVLSILMFFYECYLYLIRDSIFNVGNIILAFLIFCLILIPLILYVYFNHNKVSLIAAYAIQFSFAVLCIVFGASLALYIQKDSDYIHMYLLMTFFTAAFIYLSPLGSFTLFLVTYIYFLILLPQYASSSDARTVIVTNTAASNVAAWIMSNIMWRSRVALFRNKRLLSLQNTKLKEVSKKDAMTGLYNHETSLNILEKELKLCAEFDYPLSVILADIDDFKQINDRYGHLFGDSIIKKTAKTLIETSRGTDYVGRYGGEEFIIILPHSDINSAKTLTERIKENLKNNISTEELSVTFSGGISQWQGETVNEIIRITDKRLYAAKVNGKNRFEIELSDIQGQEKTRYFGTAPAKETD